MHLQVTNTHLTSGLRCTTHHMSDNAMPSSSVKGKKKKYKLKFED